MKRVIIIGFGGFAREVSWLIREINRHSDQEELRLVGHVISEVDASTDRSSGLLGDFHWLEKNRASWDGLVLGTGTPSVRAKLSQILESSLSSFSWPTLIHPAALFDKESAIVERGVLVCANVVGTVNLKFREFSMVNLACTLGHESEMGACCVLNPSVNVSGGVVIGRETLVGTGAQILQMVNIGERVQVGGGAVVTKDVPSGQTVVGVPAKPLLTR